VNGEADPGFTSIRTTLQSALRMPFTVAVTSSRPRDGKTEIAVGTARAFAAAGYATLIVDANPQSPDVARALELAALPAADALDADPFPVPVVTAGLPDALSIASFRLLDDAANAALRTFVARARARYAVTIFDTADVDDGPFPTACCAACDGVMLAVRYGRRRSAEDQRLIATIEGAGGRVIGSVPTRFPVRAAR
jgi:Mrp family chromosome partitioning ATPase